MDHRKGNAYQHHTYRGLHSIRISPSLLGGGSQCASISHLPLQLYWHSDDEDEDDDDASLPCGGVGDCEESDGPMLSH